MTSAPPPYSGKVYVDNQGQPTAPIMQQPVYIGSPIFIPSEYPVQCVCIRCQQTIVTRVEKTNGLLTWLIVGGLVLIGCWFGCCLIPFCIDSCKDSVHYCPSCSQILGVKKQLS